MASWADEFDIDDSDILGALNNRRKDPSQLASPPWPPAAAAPRPSLTSSSADAHNPIASSAGLLKRFQRPRSSQNGPSFSQNVSSNAFDPQRKRKQGFDLAPPLPPKAVCRQGPSLDDAICGEDLTSIFPAVRRESASQIEHGCHPESQNQGADEVALPCNGMFTVEEHCHSLSSHDASPTPAAGGISHCYSKNVVSQNYMRHEDLASSHVLLKDLQQNVCLGHSKAAPAAQHSLKQNPDLYRLQQKRTFPVQFRENGRNERSKRIANVSQQDHNLEDRLNDVQKNNLERPLGMHASNLPGKSVPDAPSVTGHRKNVGHSESRGVRFLQKDLHYQIPGPAGAVQRGLGQNKSSLSENNRMRKNNPAPCQGSVVDDADFQTGAWLKANNYIEKSSIQVSTISSLKTSRTENRVSKLLAVIKSSVPNGCGDAMVSLKDQTDSIYGTVNRRVMSETEYGRLIEAGAVILLHQVAVFSPTPYAHYLNITINNVEQVFAKKLQFFKGESSRAAPKTVLDVTEDELMDNIDNRPTKSQSRMVDQAAGENAHVKINELLEEEDELEILLGRSAHRTTD